MPDLTPEQLAQLLDEKLRPIGARLDDQAKRLEQQSERLEGALAELRWTAIKQVLALLSIVAVVGGVVLLGQALLTRLAASNATASSSSSPRLLYADDFSNPLTGLFLDHQVGLATLPSDRASASWDYSYQDGALVAHVGPPSLLLNGRLIGSSARAANRLTGDFAFEVRARATKSAGQTMFGLRYFPGTREFGFGIAPETRGYRFYELFQPPMVSARSDAIVSGDQENMLRLEVRGSSLRLFVNGQRIDDLKDEAFGARPASVGVFFDVSGPPDDGQAEVRYNDFKVYSLGN